MGSPCWCAPHNPLPLNTNGFLDSYICCCTANEWMNEWMDGVYGLCGSFSFHSPRTIGWATGSHPKSLSQGLRPRQEILQWEMSQIHPKAWPAFPSWSHRQSSFAQQVPLWPQISFPRQVPGLAKGALLHHLYNLGLPNFSKAFWCLWTLTTWDLSICKLSLASGTWLAKMQANLSQGGFEVAFPGPSYQHA